ncbi:MAG: hypothetical protein AAGH83_01235 [Pseudomonadota bacterium]
MTHPTSSLIGGLVLALGLPVAALGDEACQIATWQDCPDLMFIEPTEATEFGVGDLRKISTLLIDAERYKSIEFAQLDIPPGGTIAHWHYHEFDVVALPIQGSLRFWWMNRDTGELKNVLWDSDRRVYVLMPAGVPHFPETRGAATNTLVAEFLMSSEAGWTSEDFVAHRIDVDAPIPPEIPFTLQGLD